MKIIIPIFFCLVISLTSKAQSKPVYNIKVVDKVRHRIKGVFYAVTDTELVLLKHRSDTIRLNFVNVKDLYISKRGLILPFMLIGAGVFFVAATQSKMPLDQLANLVIGVPVGVAVGNLIGQLFANKRFYKGLEEADFPKIRTDLEKYTQVIMTQ